MNTQPSPNPSDDDINRLLARGYCDTSPRFEARWVALKRELRQRPVATTRLFPGWGRSGWFGALGAAVAVALVLYSARPTARMPTEQTFPHLNELLAMDAVLGCARALLDEENRTALLHLPAGEPPHN